MKASDPFKLDGDWWKKHKPTTLKSTGLGEVLRKYQELKEELTKFAKQGTYKGMNYASPPFDDAVEMLKKEVTVAVGKAEAACNKTLHKDALAVLGKASDVIRKEALIVLTLKGDFEKAYKTHFDDLRDKSDDEANIIVSAKTDGHAIYKDLEEDVVVVEQRIQGMTGKIKEGTATPEDIEEAYEVIDERVTMMDHRSKKLDQLAQDADTALREMKKFQGSDTLSIADRDEQINKQNEAQQKRNDVWMYQNKAHGFLATSQTSLEGFEKLIGKAKKDASSVEEQVKKVALALKGLSEDSRRHNNNFTAWENDMASMSKAKRNAQTKNISILEAMKEQGVTTPPDRWSAKVAMYLTQGNSIAKKTTKMLTQATTLRDVAVHKLNDKQAKDPAVAKHLENIKGYIESIDKYDKANAAAMENLKKKVQQFAANN